MLTAPKQKLRISHYLYTRYPIVARACPSARASKGLLHTKSFYRTIPYPRALLPQNQIKSHYIRIILLQPKFELRPMPKYSNILNFGMRHSFQFRLFSSLVDILNRSLGHNPMLANSKLFLVPKT